MFDFFFLFRVGVIAISCLLIGWWLYDVLTTYRGLPDWAKKRLWSFKISRFLPELALIAVLLAALVFLTYVQWRCF